MDIQICQNNVDTVDSLEEVSKPKIKTFIILLNLELG